MAAQRQHVARRAVGRADDHLGVAAVRHGGEGDPAAIARQGDVLDLPELHELDEAERANRPHQSFVSRADSINAMRALQTLLKFFGTTLSVFKIRPIRDGFCRNLRSRMR